MAVANDRHGIGDSHVYHFQIGGELPVDSDDAEKENKNDNGSTLLCVFERGYFSSYCHIFPRILIR